MRPPIDLSAHINQAVERGGPTNFLVTLKPVFYRANGSFREVPNRAAVVREDTGEPLAVVRAPLRRAMPPPCGVRTASRAPTVRGDPVPGHPVRLSGDRTATPSSLTSISHRVPSRGSRHVLVVIGVAGATPYPRHDPRGFCRR